MSTTIERDTEDYEAAQLRVGKWRMSIAQTRHTDTYLLMLANGAL